MKKRIISVLLCALMLALFLTGCGKKNTALNVGGAMVTKGIYAYYLDYTCANAEKLKLDTSAYRDSANEKVYEYMKKYLAVNSIFDRLGLTLSYSLKAQSASDTDSKWDLFGVHYEKAGITKQDIGKICENACCKTALLEYYYGTSSTIHPTSTKKLKSAFEKQYFGAKLIAAPLTTTDTMGNTISLDSDSLTEVRAKFTSMKNKLNSGYSIDTVYSDYNTAEGIIGAQTPETYLFTEKTVQYGEGFIAAIKNLSYNSADIYEYDDTIYLLYRVDITDSKESFFSTYKSQVLSDLHLKDLEKIIDEEASRYDVEKEYGSVIRQVWKKVEAEHPAPETKTSEK